MAIFVAACLLALTGCSALSRASDRGASRPLSVVLLDVSRSTRSPQVRAHYLDAVQRTLDAVIAEHGTIVADVIDENPLAHSTFPIDATFDACNAFTDNRLACEARTAQQRQDVIDQAEAILARQPGSAGTDIYDGVSLAGRVFASYPQASVRRLVICSDMVQRTSTEPPTPELGGVTVYVVGAGVLAETALPGERILAIQRFWLRYFARAGSDLSPARYGASLVRFP